ncbi:hypothetical protein [Brevundimonas sp. SORGH_AS_0993]|uniref:hypothetical protein n=1 Tax=Brevundimonas sp. SORGH_AS_0993 TaxID=3041794 RepID=UPI00278B0431|nr:hypothetical protein [Brevundimonas sp. SORGH_AS_0993]MDQ1154438.1 uncharacterized protein (TIGR02588 family) [Brevundimonas sp. SORGH_AS_0993]
MAALGAGVTLAVVAVVIGEALQPAAPPALSARIVQVQPTAAGFVTTIRVQNDGADTAAAVAIEGVLGGQTASATLDYVPGRGHAVAYLRFDADPRAAVVSVKGWSAP